MIVVYYLRQGLVLCQQCRGGSLLHTSDSFSLRYSLKMSGVRLDTHDRKVKIIWNNSSESVEPLNST